MKTHFIDDFNSHSTSMHHEYRCDRSSGTNHLMDLKATVNKTMGVNFGIFIQGLPYVIGINVSQHHWRMAINRGGIITGGIKMGKNPFLTISWQEARVAI